MDKMSETLERLFSTAVDRPLRTLAIGTFTVFAESFGFGVSSTMREQNCPSCVKGAGEMEGKSVLEISRLVFSNNLLEASVGLAALNSALPTSGLEFSDANAFEIIAAKAKNKTAAVIGSFPFVKDLRSFCSELYVFEKRPLPGTLPSLEIPEKIPRADVVAISGTTLINHTFEEILKFVRPSAFKIMLGPSTPLSPIMFESGIDVISGVLVEDKDIFLKYLMQGSNFRGLRGKRLVSAFAD